METNRKLRITKYKDGRRAVEQEIKSDTGWDLYTGKRVLSERVRFIRVIPYHLPQTQFPCQHLPAKIPS